LIKKRKKNTLISYPIYKIVHLLGVLMIFLSLGGITVNAINGGGKDSRKRVSITHGIGLLLALIGGFGLLARIGVSHGSIPGWAIGKLGIWFIFAIMIGVLIRKPNLARPFWGLTIFLGGIAVYLAGYKPF
jgi:hypothetical protein